MKIDWSALCLQPSLLSPPQSGLEPGSQFLTPHYRQASAELLGGAVRIPTVSYDDMESNPLNDRRFEIFKDLHEYLAAKFPLTTRHLEVVNNYGLLYTIGGRGNGKPVVLMAHQDVVPVEAQTLDQWTHGAFSGYFDGSRIWGRGAADTKSSLIAILEATESLLAQDWIPERTVLISFGFDEELDGSRGALSLARVIASRYGEKNSLYMIIDEGSGVNVLNNATFALISVAEKGYADITIEVDTPGGHSKMPPDHTGIGIMAKILSKLELEHKQRDSYELTKEDTIVPELFTCLAKFGEFDSDKTRYDYLDTEILNNILRNNLQGRALIGTTQAVDVVRGGHKINALPESVVATINYRIDGKESVKGVTSRLQQVAESVASKLDLDVSVNDHRVRSGGGSGSIKITNGQSIEPTSTSPHSIEDSRWRLLAGTTKHTLSEWFGIDTVTVAPLLLTGNTDTWRYVGLTDHVYRYTTSTPDSAGNAHTVNEYIELDGHLATVIWYYELLQFL